MVVTKDLLVHKGLTQEEFDEIAKGASLPSIPFRQFAKMAHDAVDLRLIECCAPHWVNGERMYMIQSLASGKALILAEEQASFYLLGLLESHQASSHPD